MKMGKGVLCHLFICDKKGGMGRLKFGVAQRDITPPPGTPLSGYIRRRGCATGIHDPLGAHFLVLEDGTIRVLLISLDILFLSRAFASRAKLAVAKKTGILKSRILIACTHTHSAPGLHPFRNSRQGDKEWEDGVQQALIQGAEEACHNLKAGNWGVGSGCSVIGRNRRKEKGAFDPSLSMLYIRDENKAPLAVVTSYGCHPVVLDETNLLVSSDYVEYFRKHLRRHLAPKAVILFILGAAGDVDPIQRGDFRTAEVYGQALATEAKRMIDSMDFQDELEIRVQEGALKIPFGWKPTPDEAEHVYMDHEKRHEYVSSQGNQEQIQISRAHLLWSKELQEKALHHMLPDSLESELQVIRVGKAVFLATPFELFASTALKLREKSQAATLFVTTCANGYAGYLPDEEAFAERGYEVEEAFKYVGLLPLSLSAEKLFFRKALSLIQDT